MNPAASLAATTPEEGAIPDGIVQDGVPLQNITVAQVSEPVHQAEGENLALPPSTMHVKMESVEEDSAVPLDTEMTAQADQAPKKEDITSSPPKALSEQHSIITRSPTAPMETKPPIHRVSIITSPPREPLADRQAAAAQKASASEGKIAPSEMKLQGTSLSSPTQLRKKSPSPPSESHVISPRPRSPSSPTQPRNHDLPVKQPSPSPYLPPSHSPPRGPRNQSGTYPRGNATPTGPASTRPPFGMRRRFPPSSSNSDPTPRPITPQAQSPASMEDVQPTTALPQEAPKIPPPIQTTVKLPPSLTPDLDKEMGLLQTHRARLASEYVNLAKETRRALHELDTATIDLRSAELRRKVADNQHEKARNGLLGIDYTPAVDMSVAP
ncbi:hypothetical protein DXG01_001072 [Tephrocybe rancida]|nr:hypothetical protein DXG01_001072 [Tephrocybe rancida]